LHAAHTLHVLCGLGWLSMLVNGYWLLVTVRSGCTWVIAGCRLFKYCFSRLRDKSFRGVKNWPLTVYWLCLVECGLFSGLKRQRQGEYHTLCLVFFSLVKIVPS
jgi:hypothetical protein